MSFSRVGPVALLGFLVVAFAWFAVNRGTTEPPVDRPTIASAPIGEDGEPSSAWVAKVSKLTQIGERAIAAYARAAMRIDVDDPECRLAWNTLAGIADTESNHGFYGGSRVDKDGVARPSIIGIPLDGSAGVLAIRDTDDGLLDGDTMWDRAVGPFQFIPATWRQWGADADGDGEKNPTASRMQRWPRVNTCASQAEI